jgi:hypothetical protein
MTPEQETNNEPVEVVNEPVEVVNEPVEVVNEPVEVVNEPVEETKDIINDDEAAELNKKIAAVTGSFFRALAKMSDDEIYRIAFTPEGQNSALLLDLVNNAYSTMLTAGGDLPRLHFDSYQRNVESFVKTFVFNIDSKLEANRDMLVALATGKTEKPDRISHQDIIDATSK